MAPDTQFEIKEGPNHEFDVFDWSGKRFLGSFRYFADAAKFVKNEQARRSPQESEAPHE